MQDFLAWGFSNVSYWLGEGWGKGYGDVSSLEIRAEMWDDGVDRARHGCALLSAGSNGEGGGGWGCEGDLFGGLV